MLLVDVTATVLLTLSSVPDVSRVCYVYLLRSNLKHVNSKTSRYITGQNNYIREPTGKLLYKGFSVLCCHRVWGTLAPVK